MNTFIYCVHDLKLIHYNFHLLSPLIGTVLVIVSFPFIFIPCLNSTNIPIALQFSYYALFVIIFQTGWACVQISHLALIPDLTPREDERTELTAVRYVEDLINKIILGSLSL